MPVLSPLFFQVEAVDIGHHWQAREVFIESSYNEEVLFQDSCCHSYLGPIRHTSHHSPSVVNGIILLQTVQFPDGN